MIDASFVRTMARYNRWQNRWLYAAADGLGDAARRLDRGGFFGSIHGTLSHLYWADSIWLSRFGQAEKPATGIPDSAGFVADWEDLRTRREALDATIIAWAGTFDGAVRGTLGWYSGAAGREVEAPLGVVLVHLFNHQAHHRGQVHAMLTAAGARTEDTDLFLMPAAEWEALRGADTP